MLSIMKKHQVQKRKLQLGKKTIIKLTGNSMGFRFGGGEPTKPVSECEACLPEESNGNDYTCAKNTNCNQPGQSKDPILSCDCRRRNTF
jgi:hypothetical protein